MQDIPFFLRKDFNFDKILNIKIDNIYVGLCSPSSSSVSYVSVYRTPHYVFARNVLFNEEIYPVHGYRSYKHYSDINPRVCSEGQYVSLLDSIVDSGYDWEKKPILVFRHWKRLFPFSRWDVADGFHRLAVLAALGEKSLNVGILRSNKFVSTRIVSKIMSFIYEKKR